MRYRGLLNSLSKNTSDWAAAARDLRLWMQTSDPDYPLYHLAAPEGWNKWATKPLARALTSVSASISERLSVLSPTTALPVRSSFPL